MFLNQNHNHDDKPVDGNSHSNILLHILCDMKILCAIFVRHIDDDQNEDMLHMINDNKCDK